MTRTIKVDDNTSISYLYRDSVFRITNKGTYTDRKTVEEAKKVLDIVAPDNPYTKQVLTERLVNTMEEITDLSFTYDNMGYVKTLQLNDYKDYALFLDAEKGKLRILGTDIIFDLTLNITPTDYKGTIQDYYSRTIGLNISNDNIEFLYNLIVSYFNPNVKTKNNPEATNEYSNTTNNTIVRTNDNVLMYTNKIYGSNYSNNLPLSYTLTLNPNNTLVPDITHEAYILQLQENVITLTDTVPSYIHVGDTLQLTNVITTVNDTEYSADGNYTVTDIKDNTITVSSNFPTPYVYVPPTLNLCAYKTSIEEAHRANATDNNNNFNTLTFDNSTDLSNYFVGDTITIHGSEYTTDLQTFSIDGEYTIMDIQGHIITLEEDLPTDYPYGNLTSNPYIYKEVLIGNVESCTPNETLTNSEIVLEKLEVPVETLTNSPTVFVRKQDNTVQYATLTNFDSTYNTATVTGNMGNWTTQIGKLYLLESSTEVLISITDSNLDNMPNTEFIVDNTDEANAYLGLLDSDTNPEKNLVKPTEVCYNNSNKGVPETLKDKTDGNNMYIEVGEIENPEDNTQLIPNKIYFTCSGLYTEVYNT